MKKILLCLFLQPFMIYSQNSSNSSIRGVITYYFNEYQGNKPDIGAEVFILDSAAIKFNEATVDSFHYANFYRNLARDYKAMGSPIPQDVLSQVTKYKTDDENFFKSLDERNFIEFLKVKSSDQNYTANVDGSGNYSINVRPGTYYVFIKSHNRDGSTMSEIMGKMFFKKTHVLADKTVNVSMNFDLH